MEQPKIEAFLPRSAPEARFGAFQLLLSTGELRKHGVRVRLQSKPFQLLRALIENAGHVVTRGQLKEKLWASDTFVDFESGLNTAVNRLRVALSDSAEHPIYVETLSRIGYRFIAPVVISTGERIEPKKPQDLRVLTIATGNTKRPVDVLGPAGPGSLKWIILGCLSVIALCAGSVVLSNINSPLQQPKFRQITFRRGAINNARFLRNGGTAILSATWGGEKSQLFLLNLLKPDPQKLGFVNARLAAISPSDQVAMFVKDPGSEVTKLEAMRLGTAVPQKIFTGALAADWAPDSTLYLIKEQNSVFSIEDASGRLIYTARTGWISNLRVFSKERIAFAEHPVLGDDAGRVMLVNSSGVARVLSAGWASLDGLAWHPSGREVWFTAAASGVDRALMAADLSGRVRQVAQGPGGLELQDIDSSGQVLIARSTERMMMTLRDSSWTAGRDISWLDWSRAAAISADGKTVLFDETGSGGGKDYAVYLYQVDTGVVRRIGSGRAIDLSFDAHWALTQSSADPTKLLLVATANGQSTPISTGGLSYRWAKFVSSGNSPQILFEATGPGEEPHIYKQVLPNGTPITLSFPAPCDAPVVNTGSTLAASSNRNEIYIFDLVSGRTRSLKMEAHAYPIAFRNNKEILTSRRDNGAILIESLNLQTGQLSLYRTLDSLSSSGTVDLLPLYIASDFHTIVYSRMQNLSDLFLVSGLK